jgi:hypothetical protein
VILSSAPKELKEARCLKLGANEYVQKNLNYYVFADSIHGSVQFWLMSAGSEKTSNRGQLSHMAQNAALESLRFINAGH